VLCLRRHRKVRPQRLPRMRRDRTVPSLPRHWQVRRLPRRRLHPEPQRHRHLQELRWNGDDGSRLAHARRRERARRRPVADRDLSRMRQEMERGTGDLPALRIHQASMPWLRSRLGHGSHVLQQVRLRKSCGSAGRSSWSVVSQRRPAAIRLRSARSSATVRYWRESSQP